MNYERNHRRPGFRRRSARKPGGGQSRAKVGLVTAYSRIFPLITAFPNVGLERQSTHKTRKEDKGGPWGVFPLFQPEQPAAQCVTAEMAPPGFVPIRGKSC